MKKKILSGLALVVLAAIMQSAAPQDDQVMTKENGTYIVNTTTLGKKVIGYVDATPVKIYIKNGKIDKVIDEYLKVCG